MTRQDCWLGLLTGGKFSVAAVIRVWIVEAYLAIFFLVREGGTLAAFE